MHNFFLFCLWYIVIWIWNSFFCVLLLIQTIQIHFSVHLFFLFCFFFFQRRWIIICVHTDTELSRALWQWVIWWWWAYSFTNFLLPNRGYDFPMREHLTIYQRRRVGREAGSNFCYSTEFGSLHFLVAVHDRLIVCLFVCCLPAYLFSFI